MEILLQLVKLGQYVPVDGQALLAQLAANKKSQSGTTAASAPATGPASTSETTPATNSAAATVPASIANDESSSNDSATIAVQNARIAALAALGLTEKHVDAMSTQSKMKTENQIADTVRDQIGSQGVSKKGILVNIRA